MRSDVDPNSVNTAIGRSEQSSGVPEARRDPGPYGRPVLERTRRLWDRQDRSVGDRTGLFAAVAAAVDVDTVLYPGSYVDLAPSFIWPSVTYVDVDRRAHQFFADEEEVSELLSEHGVNTGLHAVRFIAADYTDDLGIAEESFDLLISPYAGFISEHCTRHLRPGGYLLVNPSHGDAARASIDARYRLCGVVVSGSGGYSVRTDELDTYLVPKRDVDVTVELIHQTGRGVAYTRSPFAYLFQRVR